MGSGRAPPECPVCGSSGDELYDALSDQLLDIPGTWRMFRCRACGVLWIDPRPRPDELTALYENYCVPVPQTPPVGIWPWVKREVLAVRFGYEQPTNSALPFVGSMVSVLCPPIREIIGGGVMFVNGQRKGHLLDVGCGGGQFLSTMKSLGWSVQGVEFDPSSAKQAADRTGAQIFCGVLEEARLPPASFDAVTLHHVVEHLHNPVVTLQECRRILKPAGRIYLLTPNAKSLAHRIFGQNWRGLEVPRHLQVYTTDSIRRVLESAGFVMETLRTTARSASLLWNLSRVLSREGRLPRPLTIGAWTKLEGLIFHGLEHAACYAGDWGEEILAIGVPGNR